MALDFSPRLFDSTETGLADSLSRSSSQEQQHHLGVFRRRRPIRLARARSSVGDGGATGALKNLAWAANAAIQRAPSRLYRLHDQGSQQQTTPTSSAANPSFHPRKSQSFRDLKVAVERESNTTTTSCSGPEFIVKSSLPPHTLTLAHQPKKVCPSLTIHYYISSLLFATTTTIKSSRPC